MKSKGDCGEEQAVLFLEDQGLEIITRNYRCVCGEIDIIARDGETLCFVEVRSRTHADFGTPQATVDKIKQKKIIKTAQLYLQKHHKSGGKITSPLLPACRFDVVALLAGQSPEWFKDAFV
ncbi:YraN family protein [bacterium]|nr:YraN family protein [bacterium]